MKVILINLHGARVDAFGAYGGTLAATPNFDRLAAEGVVFDQHYADWIGLHSEGDRDTSEFMGGQLREGLRAARVPTVVVADHRIGQRIQTKHWKQLQIMQAEDLPVLEQPTLADATFQGAVNWVQDNGHHYPSWLLTIEVGALLPPWDEKELFTSGRTAEASSGEEASASPVFEYSDTGEGAAPSERFGWKTAYGGVMQYVDDLFGQFLKLLRELELDSECVIAVTGPDGQTLGERSEVPHRIKGLHEERVHRPLIVRLPGREGAGRRIHHLTLTADWGWTLFDLFKLTPPVPHPRFVTFGGKSLWPLLSSRGARLREYAVLGTGEFRFTWWEQSIRTPDWYYILPADRKNPRPAQLYRKPEDRWEMNNVLSQYPDVADHLELTLLRYVQWRVDGQGDPPALRDDLVKVVKS